MRRPLNLIRLAAATGLALTLVGVPGTAHAADPLIPTVNGAYPLSPSEDLNPEFWGYTFYRHDPVYIYDNAKCAGTPLAQARIVAYGGTNYRWYAKVTVSPGSTTDVYARISGGANGTSGCSSARSVMGHYVYKNTLMPINTQLTKKPKKVVKTTGKRAKVKFQFKAVSNGKRSARAAAKTSFYCSMDGKAQRACKSGVTYKVKRGKHTFSVAASKNGGLDPTPATYTFKVKKKK